MFMSQVINAIENRSQRLLIAIIQLLHHGLWYDHCFRLQIATAAAMHEAASLYYFHMFPYIIYLM